MKKLCIIFSWFLMLFTACDRVYENGCLDGQWKLLSVEKDGVVEYPANIITYSFQRHTMLLALHYDEELPDRYIGEFDYSGGYIYASGFVKFPGVSAECDVQELERYYFISDSERFKVERLDCECLVLSTDGRRYRLRKW